MPAFPAAAVVAALLDPAVGRTGDLQVYNLDQITTNLGLKTRNLGPISSSVYGLRKVKLVLRIPRIRRSTRRKLELF